MKNILRLPVILTASCLLFLSCEDWLDKSPDMGVTEDDIYVNFKSIQGFLDRTYDMLDHLHEFSRHENGRSHIGSISDEFASLFNSAQVRQMNSGNWLMKSGSTFEIGVKGNTSISLSYQAIRIANRVIANLDRVPGLSDEQHDRLMGQARFMRAWFYFRLMVRYGGMPIFDEVFVGDGDEDKPRVTYHESHEWMMEDLEAAITLLPDRWDDDNVGRVTKVAAMALKSMSQLYDASPLMQNGLSSLQVLGYDTERAEIAAKSADDVLRYIDDNPSLGYKLNSREDYKNIFYFDAPPFTQPEFLWYNRVNASGGNGGQTRYIRCFWLTSAYASGTGNDATAFNAPTQNMVNMFEKRGTDGKYYPITDSRAGYDAQDPYADRDPRFENNIIIPGQKWGNNRGGVAQYVTLYQDGDMANTLLTNQHTNQRQQTGYHCKKFLWESANQWQEGYDAFRVITVYIRLTQIYLDYAEAAFEATGSATQGVAGCKYTPLQALNIIRNRAGVGDLPDDYASDPAKFRESLRRERTVELMFENHRWWDIRRWMTMHDIFSGAYPIKGIRATPKDPNHKSVTDKSTLEFTYEEIDVIPEVRNYGMRNYWYPFPIEDVNSLVNLVQNPGW